MAFGRKPQAHQPRIYSPAEAPQAPRPQSESNLPVGTLLLGGLIFIGVVCLFTFMPAPFYVYHESKVHYSGMQLAGFAMGRLADPEKQRQREARMAVDFSQILRDPNTETSQYMELVADSCMPASRASAPIMPNKIYPAYAQAVGYLSCAMNTYKERLCHQSERTRLVGQLRQYLTVHQHVLGVQRNRQELMKGKMANSMAKQFKKWDAMINDGKKKRRRVVVEPPIIPETIDSRISARLAALTRDGYISASDFGWMGLVLPAEYAPYLAEKPQNAPAC